MANLQELLLVSLAVGSTSMILARSRMFREARWLVARYGGEFAWDFCVCPWCMSTWLAFLAAWLCGPLMLSNHYLIDWFLTSMVIVSLAPLAAFFIHRIYGPLPPVPTEQEWKDGTPQDEED